MFVLILLIHVDYSDTSTCFCLFPAPIPHSPPKKKSHTCVNFSKRCLDNKALPGTCETGPQPSMSCAPSWQDSIGNHTRISESYGIIREHDTTSTSMIHKIMRLQASTGGGVGTGVTSFNASANQKQIGRKQPVAQRSATAMLFPTARPCSALSLGIPTCRWCSKGMYHGCILLPRESRWPLRPCCWLHTTNRHVPLVFAAWEA